MQEQVYLVVGPLNIQELFERIQFRTKLAEYEFELNHKNYIKFELNNATITIYFINKSDFVCNGEIDLSIEVQRLDPSLDLEPENVFFYPELEETISYYLILGSKSDVVFGSDQTVEKLLDKLSNEKSTLPIKTKEPTEADILEQKDSFKLFILFLGAFSRGKSTLVNHLIRILSNRSKLRQPTGRGRTTTKFEIFHFSNSPGTNTGFNELEISPSKNIEIDQDYFPFIESVYITDAMGSNSGDDVVPKLEEFIQNQNIKHISIIYLANHSDFDSIDSIFIDQLLNTENVREKVLTLDLLTNYIISDNSSDNSKIPSISFDTGLYRKKRTYNKKYNIPSAIFTNKLVLEDAPPIMDKILYEFLSNIYLKARCISEFNKCKRKSSQLIRQYRDSVRIYSELKKLYDKFLMDDHLYRILRIYYNNSKIEHNNYPPGKTAKDLQILIDIIVQIIGNEIRTSELELYFLSSSLSVKTGYNFHALRILIGSINDYYFKEISLLEELDKDDESLKTLLQEFGDELIKKLIKLNQFNGANFLTKTRFNELKAHQNKIFVRSKKRGNFEKDSPEFFRHRKQLNKIISSRKEFLELYEQ